MAEPNVLGLQVTRKIRHKVAAHDLDARGARDGRWKALQLKGVRGDGRGLRKKMVETTHLPLVYCFVKLIVYNFFVVASATRLSRYQRESKW